MTFTPAHITITISSYPFVDTKKEADYQINRALAYLYTQGFRRMSTHRLPRTGDHERFKVFGLK